jgi:hypothetical protein
MILASTSERHGAGPIPVFVAEVYKAQLFLRNGLKPSEPTIKSLKIVKLGLYPVWH